MSLGITNKLSIIYLFSYILQIYFILFPELLHQLCSIKVKQSRCRPGVAQRVPGS